MTTRTKATWMLYGLSIVAFTVSAWLRHPVRPVAAAAQTVGFGLLIAALVLLLVAVQEWSIK